MNPTLLYTLISLGGVGFVLGAILAFAAQKFAVEVDPRVEKVTSILPGANCGGCGYAGCAQFAEAVVMHFESPTLCAPGGAEVVRRISEFLGRDVTQSVRKIAFLHCNGTRENAKDKMIYDGVHDCRMAAMISGGHKACQYGCLGFGTCVEACKFDALHMGEHGLPVVDREKCTACGACVRACPKNLFTLEPDTTAIYLACSSHDRGKSVKDVCSVGCIACGICAKVTEGELVEMADNLPVVKYDESPNLVVARYKCPTHSYIDLAPKRPHMAVIDVKCKGTHKCAEVCPVKDCITGEPGSVHAIDPRTCIGCGRCVDICPEKAIRVIGAMGYVGMNVSS